MRQTCVILYFRGLKTRQITLLQQRIHMVAKFFIPGNLRWTLKNSHQGEDKTYADCLWKMERNKMCFYMTTLNSTAGIKKVNILGNLVGAVGFPACTHKSEKLRQRM